MTKSKGRRKSKKKKKTGPIYTPAVVGNAVVNRSLVEVKADYHSYLQELRDDFWFSCAYCSCTEIEACGIGFQIDHYLPRHSNPELENKYNNLMYSCQKCNSFKSGWISSKKAIELGYRVIKVDESDPRDFFKLVDDKLVGLDKTGDFNIQLLELNRDSLKRLRRIREKFYEAKEYVAFGIAQLKKMRIDDLKKRTRFQFDSIRKQVYSHNKHLQINTEKMLKNLARSPMIEPETDKWKKSKQRRAYLKNIKAINYDL